MEINLTVSTEDRDLVAAAFKHASGGYPTNDSDQKIVTDGVTNYVRWVVAQYQTSLLQEQAEQDAQAIADNITLQ